MWCFLFHGKHWYTTIIEWWGVPIYGSKCRKCGKEWNY